MAKILELYQRFYYSASGCASDLHTTNDIRRLAVIGLSNYLEEKHGPMKDWPQELHYDFTAIYECVASGYCPVRNLGVMKLGA